MRLRGPDNRTRRTAFATGLATLGLLVATSCGTAGIPGTTPSGSIGPTSTATDPSPDASSPDSGSTSPTASSSADSTGTPTPPVTTPTPTPAPGSDSSPGAGPASATATPGPATAGCGAVVPQRVEQVDTQPRRTTEVISLQSDGRALTSGTRDQTEFRIPTLEAPSGEEELTDRATMNKVAALVAASAKKRVLLDRPEAPDAKASVGQRPFNTPGVYVLYNASSPMTATVVLTCDGREQRWSFSGETDPATGQVNCAVKPARTNALAHVVYTNNCE
ncbi:MAG TPA: hypothetical protein VF642_06530 [Propionibacteriaceae bacterium]